MRTALQNIEKGGLIIRLPQRGFYVYKFTKKDIKELFAIRKALEGYAVETIATLKITMDISQLSKHLQGQEKVIQSDNFTAFIQEDKKFHEYLIKVMNNKRLAAIYSDLRQSIELIGLQRFKRNSQRHLPLIEHQKTIKELEAGDPITARKAVYAHLDFALRLLLQNNE